VSECSVESDELTSSETSIKNPAPNRRIEAERGVEHDVGRGGGNGESGHTAHGSTGRLGQESSQWNSSDDASGVSEKL
jgi:hypothetical protein